MWAYLTGHSRSGTDVADEPSDKHVTSATDDSEVRSSQVLNLTSPEQTVAPCIQHLSDTQQAASDGVTGCENCDDPSLTTLIEAFPSPLMIVDATTFRICVANSAATSERQEDFCYLANHGNDRPCYLDGQDCPVQLVRQTGEPVTVEHDHRSEDLGGKFVEVHAYPIRNGEGEVVRVVISCIDITARRESAERLQLLNGQLEAERRALEEKHIALKEVLNQIAGQRQQFAETMQTNIDKLVRPALGQLSRLVPAGARHHVESIDMMLSDLMSPFIGQLESMNAKLSPREVEISQHIKNGDSSKEIADSLHISEHTVLKIRQRIRRKLGLNRSKTNLAVYLRSLG